MKSAPTSGTSILAEGGWVLGARLTSVLVSIAALKLLTTFLPPSEFGRWSLFTGAAALTSGVLGGVLNQGIGRFANDAFHARTVRDLVLRGTGLHVALCGLSIIPVAIWCWFDPAALGPPVSLVILAVLASAILGSVYLLVSGMLNALRVRDGWAASTVVEGIVRILALAGGLAWIGQTFWTPVLSTLASMLVGIAVAAVWLGRLCAVHEADETKFTMWGDVRSFAMPLIIIELGWWMLVPGNRYLLEGFVGLEDVAVYAVSTGISIGIVGAADGIITSVTLPILYSKLPKVSDEEIRRRGALSSVVAIQAVILTTCGIPFLATPLLHLLTSEHYHSFSILVGVCVIVEWIRSVSGQLSVAFYAERRTNEMISPMVVAVVIQIAAAIPLIWRFGVWGAVLTSLVAYFALMIMRLKLIPGVFQIEGHWRSWAIRVAAVALAGVALAADGFPLEQNQPDVIRASVILLLYAAIAGAATLSMRRIWEGMLSHA